MGIVVRQSVSNTVITYAGFAIGAVNTLLMYPQILGDTFYGLTAFLLSTANLVMPIMAFGAHSTIIKYFNGYTAEEERSRFLSFMLVLPLGIALVIFALCFWFYKEIAGVLSIRNAIVFDYIWQIPVIALCMGYFEIFYAWVKVHLQSVFGNFIKEVLIRLLITALLIAVYVRSLSIVDFIYATVVVYAVAALLMGIAAYRVRQFRFSKRLPVNRRQIVTYSLFIIFSGSIATLLLDVDKFMLAQYIAIEQIAYYSVAVFIATSVAVPGRAMQQITYPITAKLMSEGKWEQLNDLYKKSSITLQIAGGYVLLGILINIKMVYAFLPPAYSNGIFAVFAIGISRYFDLMLGINNAIIFNSKYYRVVLLLGLGLAVVAVGLNATLIPTMYIDGAALATLLAIALYTLAKLFFVVVRMNLNPFTLKNVYLVVLSVGLFGVFYFWDFNFHPLLSIVVKSTLFSVAYGFGVYFFRFSDDANQFIKMAGQKLRLK